MSILSQLFKKNITFTQAATQAAEWASQVAAHDPVLVQASGEALSIIKQGASNAIMLADTALGQIISPAADAVELALETALAKATGGVSVAFNPMISSSIDQMAAVVKTAADAWAMEAKAKLANTSSTPPAT
jgi:hypothetical protein